MMRPCLDCGHPTNAERCEPCATRFNRGRYAQQTVARKTNGGRPQYGAGWTAYSKQVRATATRCWICGNGPNPNDPWQADHIQPVSQRGGGTGAAAPAHRSCNIARANKLRAGKPDPAHQPTTNRRGARPPHTTS
jgi:hypothetical protein